MQRSRRAGDGQRLSRYPLRPARFQVAPLSVPRRVYLWSGLTRVWFWACAVCQCFEGWGAPTDVTSYRSSDCSARAYLAGPSPHDTHPPIRAHVHTRAYTDAHLVEEHRHGYRHTVTYTLSPCATSTLLSYDAVFGAQECVPATTAGLVSRRRPQLDESAPSAPALASATATPVCASATTVSLETRANEVSALLVSATVHAVPRFPLPLACVSLWP